MIQNDEKSIFSQKDAIMSEKQDETSEKKRKGDQID
jgi:hypothetical protein